MKPRKMHQVSGKKKVKDSDCDRKQEKNQFIALMEECPLDLFNQLRFSKYPDTRICDIDEMKVRHVVKGSQMTRESEFQFSIKYFTLPLVPSSFPANIERYEVPPNFPDSLSACEAPGCSSSAALAESLLLTDASSSSLPLPGQSSATYGSVYIPITYLKSLFTSSLESTRESSFTSILSGSHQQPLPIRDCFLALLVVANERGLPLRNSPAGDVIFKFER